MYATVYLAIYLLKLQICHNKVELSWVDWQLNKNNKIIQLESNELCENNKYVNSSLEQHFYDKVLIIIQTSLFER